MIRLLRISVLGVLLAASVSAFGQAGDAKVRIDGAWARRAPMLQGDGNGAVYATLVNPGKEPDALIAAASDAAAAVEIHESFQESGMMKMRRVEKIDVAAGKAVELKPGGYHIMLLNLKRDLKPGAAVNLMLQFKNAGKIPVSAEIR